MPEPERVKRSATMDANHAGLDKALRVKPIARIRAGTFERADDVLAVEEPLEIRVNGHSVAVVMRTPGRDRELAAGFLVTEGLIRVRDDVVDMIYCGTHPAEPAQAGERGKGGQRSGPQENVLDVILARGVAIDFARLSRNVFTSSSCGICSKASIEAVRTQFPALASPLSPRRAVIAALPEKLRAAQAAFAATGGLHASALFEASGKLVTVHEDVGRHNALDKVIGECFLADRLPLADHVLLVSGRVSFEIMQKALAAGIRCVAAISAPTSAAVELAQESGQTLVGFLRAERVSNGRRMKAAAATGSAMRMNVYAGTLTE